MLFRRFRNADIPAAQRLSLEAGWPHRVEDWEFVLALGRGVVAEDHEGLAGTILTWKHDRRFASIGMVLVARRLRRRGIGLQLTRHALRELSGRSILLNATAQGAPLYERLGFRTYRTIAQHQGADARLAPMAPARGERLRAVGRSDGARLAALATRAAGWSRTRLLARLLDRSDGIVLDRDGEPIGFALVRRFGRGHVIGPVVAPDAERAKVLIGHWVAHRPRAFLRIDTPTTCRFGRWLDAMGLPETERVAGMVLGDAPPVDPQARTFALVNQALG